MIPSFRAWITLLIFRRWAETAFYAVVSDLFIRPRRAWLRFQLTQTIRLMRQAFRKQEYDSVERLAALAIELAQQVGQHAIRDEAIHICHQYWGFVCSEKKDWISAIYHLEESTKIEGTLLLRALAPSLRLSRALVEHGDIKPVLKNLEELRRWWACDSPFGERTAAERERLIKGWMQKVQKGQVPNDHTWRPYGD